MMTVRAQGECTPQIQSHARAEATGSIGGDPRAGFMCTLSGFIDYDGQPLDLASATISVEAFRDVGVRLPIATTFEVVNMALAVSGHVTLPRTERDAVVTFEVVVDGLEFTFTSMLLWKEPIQ